MNKQEIFDTVAGHLLTQKYQSRSLIGNYEQGCVYHGENFTSCAVGCLIPRTVNTECIENMVASDPDVMVLLALPEVGVLEPFRSDEATTPENEARVNLLRSLQLLHDGEMVGNANVVMKRFENEDEYLAHIRAQLNSIASRHSVKGLA